MTPEQEAADRLLTEVGITRALVVVGQDMRFSDDIETVVNALAALEAENERLRAGVAQFVEAFDSVSWMAESWADGGGRGGPEMRDYQRAVNLIDEVRALLAPAAGDGQAGEG